MEMPQFDVSVNIQWSLRVGAPSWDQAKDLVNDTVDQLLSDVRYQEIRDESIDIDIREV